ncbi:Hsp20/alpha crystallin family protein [Streptomyces sp. NPDC005483]|uniref:Hsp20/alpha crystallin family protein n=1 Tax=Streptomyces sp. NPDC005483 TaxID=3154882 RepID=UPI0033A71BB6
MELELPGVAKDQITVEVAEGELDIHSEIREKEHTGTVRRQTPRIGQFDYRTILPPNSDTEHISADLNNGVLTVKVPKTEKGKASAHRDHRLSRSTAVRERGGEQLPRSGAA